MSTAAEFIGKEIVRCITLAEGGIHAVLLVFTVRGRPTDEEQSVLYHLQTLFGSKISDYMIIVFTGGDDLDDNDETLEDYLGQECPEFLKVSNILFTSFFFLFVPALLMHVFFLIV